MVTSVRYPYRGAKLCSQHEWKAAHNLPYLSAPGNPTLPVSEDAALKCTRLHPHMYRELRIIINP